MFSFRQAAKSSIQRHKTIHPCQTEEVDCKESGKNMERTSMPSLFQSSSWGAMSERRVGTSGTRMRIMERPRSRITFLLGGAMAAGQTAVSRGPSAAETAAAGGRRPSLLLFF